MTGIADRIRHDAAAQRFSVLVDGEEGLLEYIAGGHAIVITHTAVPAAIGGRGIAGALVLAALEYARANGLKVIPRCSYAARYFDTHPEYAELRG
jgi:predicted GNAT family acetyltransferase